MIKRILWFFFLGVIVFIFLSSFPFDEPSLAVDWLVETSFKVRNFIVSLVDWVPVVGDNLDTTPAEPLELDSNSE